MKKRKKYINKQIISAIIIIILITISVITIIIITIIIITINHQNYHYPHHHTSTIFLLVIIIILVTFIVCKILTSCSAHIWSSSAYCSLLLLPELLHRFIKKSSSTSVGICSWNDEPRVILDGNRGSVIAVIKGDCSNEEEDDDDFL